MNTGGVYRPDLTLEERVRQAMEALTIIHAAASVDVDDVADPDELMASIATTAQEAAAVLRAVKLAPGEIQNWQPTKRGAR